MKIEDIIKRKTSDGLYIFYNSDRTFKSPKFKTRQLREDAILEYIKNALDLQKQIEFKRKKEYELTHA